MNTDSTKDFKPLPTYIELMDIPNQGKGLVTTKQLQMNDVIGVSHYTVKDSHKGKFHQGLVRTSIGGFLNHSDKPNCRLVCGDGDDCDIYYLQVRNPIILPNTQLTINYQLHKCGSENFCIQKIDSVLDELRYFDHSFRMSDDHEKHNEQQHLESKIMGMIRELGDTEKGELVAKLEEAEQHYFIKHFGL